MLPPMTDSQRIPAALLVAVGIALAGWFTGHGFREGRRADRYVTVKGVAEREVEADVALWPIRFVATDDDLGRAQQRLKTSQAAVTAFLARHGIDSAAIEVSGIDVTDVYANPYQSGTVRSRYIITEGIMVRSDAPRTIQKASQAVGELVEAGIVLSGSDGMRGGPTFLFTRLNDVKPAMIAEATASARAAAEQFAHDSGSRLAGIRTANQGTFVLLPRDQAPGVMEEGEFHKTVRVVTTVEYALED
jgi:uncharacterized protein